MGVIIRMDSKKFIKDFLPTVEHKDYQFILISEFITTKDKFKNVKAIQRLMPPPQILGEYVNDNEKAYKKSYLNYLQHPSIEAMIAIIVKAAVENDMKIVLMCSRSEDEFNYLKYICEYIEAVFKLTTYTGKEYMKDMEKASKIKNKDEILKVLGKKFENMQKAGADLTTTQDKDKYVKELKKMGKKAMKKLAKSRDIKLKDGLGKEEMAKKLAKKLLA